MKGILSPALETLERGEDLLCSSEELFYNQLSARGAQHLDLAGDGIRPQRALEDCEQQIGVIVGSQAVDRDARALRAAVDEHQLAAAPIFL